MMVSAWNFAKPSMRLQYRLFQVSWMRDCSGINCSKDSSNSSFPVRYTPNKSLKHEDPTPLNPTDSNKMKLSKRASLKLEAPSDRHTSGCSIELSKKSQDQNQATLPSASFDEKAGMQEELHYSSSIEIDEYIEELDEVSGELNTRSEHSTHSCKSSIHDVEKIAIELLATRAFTAFELRKKLTSKKFPLYIVNDVIMNLLSRGFINDSLYAESFSRSRWSSSTWGPRRIKQALSQKGISGVDAEKAIKLVFMESNPNIEEEEQEPNMGMSKLSMDHLLAQAAKKWDLSENIPIEKRKARVIGWLQYRGFNWGVIGFVLKKLQAKYSNSF